MDAPGRGEPVLTGLETSEAVVAVEMEMGAATATGEGETGVAGRGAATGTGLVGAAGLEGATGELGAGEGGPSMRPRRARTRSSVKSAKLEVLI